MVKQDLLYRYGGNALSRRVIETPVGSLHANGKKLGQIETHPICIEFYIYSHLSTTDEIVNLYTRSVKRLSICFSRTSTLLDVKKGVHRACFPSGSSASDHALSVWSLESHVTNQDEMNVNELLDVNTNGEPSKSTLEYLGIMSGTSFLLTVRESGNLDSELSFKGWK